jgi:RND family efflux transporter MFP subunit
MLPKAIRTLLRTLRWLLPISIIGGALVFRFVIMAPELEASVVPAIPVRTIRPVQGDLARTLNLNGHVESETMVTVLPMVSGVLQELFVDVGQKVKKDQIIARIDAQRYELQLQQAKAAYLSAKSAYERIDQLYRANATSQQTHDQTRSQYEAYSSQYELARIQLGYASIKSPMDGVVLMRHLSVGSIAAPERAIVTIGDIADLIIRAKIPEKHYETFVWAKESMRIRIRRSDGAEYPGIIRNISPFVSAETKNFETVIAIGGNAAALRPGMFVAMEFELARWSNVLYLPFEALSGGNRLWWVQDGVARSTAFNPVQSSDSAFVVTPEWAERDVIIEGHFFAREGSPVITVGSGSPTRVDQSAGKP